MKGGDAVVDFGLATLMWITILVYFITMYAYCNDIIPTDYLPIFAAFIGGIIGLCEYGFRIEDYPASDFLSAFCVGVIAGMSAVGLDQIFKRNFE